MRKKAARLIMLMLAAAMLLQVPAFAAAGFSDVPAGEWYVGDVSRAVNEGILHGDPGGTFRPQDNLTYGEFYTVMVNCMTRRFGFEYDNPPSNTGHWARPCYTILREMGALINVKADDSDAALNAYIDRYNAALIIYNCLFTLGREKRNTIAEPEKIFADYGSMPYEYRFAVVQLYGKGVVSGYEDHCYHGERLIRRCEIANLICRFIWNSDRVAVDSSVYYTPVAKQWQQNGWIDGYGNASPELCMILTGRSDRPYFTSSAEAAGHMTNITVPVWKVDSRGMKYSSTAQLTVNTAVEKDVRAIFEIIYNDPERFPICDVGGARFSDTMRHAWGCAIDVNWDYNAECRAYYNYDDSINYVQQTCGSGWWPAGTEWTAFAGSIPYASIYSIPRGGSVENAFREYGWGWGGNGWSKRGDNSRGYDYMHFSVMESGG